MLSLLHFPYYICFWMPLCVVGFAFLLCLVLGFTVEKWRHGGTRNLRRSLGFGVLILCANVATYFVFNYLLLWLQAAS